MTTQAPGQAPRAEAVEGTPAAPAPSTPQEGAFDATGWLKGLDARQRAAIDDYAAFHRKPLETEKHGLLSEIGRLKKATDSVIVARLQAEEALVGQMKAATVALYGVDSKDLEEIETIDQLNTALRWIGRTPKAPPAKAAMPPGIDPDVWQQFLDSRSAPAKGLEPMAPRGGVPSAPQVTKDNIDFLYMEAERAGANPNPYAAKYQQLLRYGRLS